MPDKKSTFLEDLRWVDFSRQRAAHNVADIAWRGQRRRFTLAPRLVNCSYKQLMRVKALLAIYRQRA